MSCSRVRASPFWDVRIPNVVSVVYSTGALSYASAIVMPAGVVPALVATMPPPPPDRGQRGGHGTIYPAPYGAAGTWGLPSVPMGMERCVSPEVLS